MDKYIKFNGKIMKKLAFFVLMMFSTVTFAENWELISETSDGYRIIADSDSYKFEKYEKDKFRAFAVMQIVGNGENSPPFITAIDVDDCIYKQSGPIVNVFPDNTKKGYFWSVKGDKIYDAQGSWLCLVTIQTLQDANAKAKKDKRFTYM
jgi:hypothetical protein